MVFLCHPIRLVHDQVYTYVKECKLAFAHMLTEYRVTVTQTSNCHRLFLCYFWTCFMFLSCTVAHHMSCDMTKSTKWHVRPAKTQISLGIRPVWSESSLSAWRKLGSLATHWAHSEDSDQTGLMPRLIWVFAGRTCHFVGFVTRRLNYEHRCSLW